MRGACPIYRFNPPHLIIFSVLAFVVVSPWHFSLASLSLLLHPAAPAGRDDCFRSFFHSDCITEVTHGIDCGFDSFCDQTSFSTTSWDVDESCDDEIEACMGDSECFQCATAGLSSTEGSIDENCADPMWADSCSAYEDFLCCAIEEAMDEGCKDNAELVEYFGASQTRVAGWF